MVEIKKIEEKNEEKNMEKINENEISKIVNFFSAFQENLLSNIAPF